VAIPLAGTFDVTVIAKIDENAMRGAAQRFDPVVDVRPNVKLGKAGAFSPDAKIDGWQAQRSQVHQAAHCVGGGEPLLPANLFVRGGGCGLRRQTSVACRRCCPVPTGW